MVFSPNIPRGVPSAVHSLQVLPEEPWLMATLGPHRKFSVPAIMLLWTGFSTLMAEALLISALGSQMEEILNKI